MDVFLPIAPAEFEFCHPVREEDFETFNVLVNGTPRHTTWRPIAVTLVHDDEGKPLVASDAPWLGRHALIFRRHAIDQLRSVLEPLGEILPLDCPEAELFVFNATRVLDALDQGASTLFRFSSGKVMDIKRYVFREAALDGTDIFKIPDLRVSPTFVSERVVRAWNSAGLRGLTFDKVWSSAPADA